MTPKERAQRGIRSMIQKRGGNYKDLDLPVFFGPVNS